MIARLVVSLLVCLSSVGCVVTSLRPLHLAGGEEFDSRLLGGWSDVHETGTVWRFTPGEDRSYAVVATDNERKTNEYAVRLVRLDDTRYIEVRPEGTDLFAVPANFLARIEIERDRFRLDWLSPKAFRRLCAEGAIDPSYEETEGDGVLLTASASQVADLLRRAEAAGAFDEHAEYVRVSEAP